jgi:hypothetical protein
MSQESVVSFKRVLGLGTSVFDLCIVRWFIPPLCLTDRHVEKRRPKTQGQQPAQTDNGILTTDYA